VFNKVDKSLVNKINKAIMVAGTDIMSSKVETEAFIKTLTPNRLGTEYYEFRGVNYILDIQRSQLEGTIGGAIMNTSSIKPIVINMSMILDTIKGMLKVLQLEDNDENIEMMRLEMINHECGHHIRGHITNVGRFNTLEDLGKIYVDEEIAVNNEVGSNNYTNVLKKVVNKVGYEPYTQGGIMGVTFLNRNTMTDTLSLIKNNHDWFLNNAGQAWIDEMEKGLEIKLNTGE